MDRMTIEQLLLCQVGAHVVQTGEVPTCVYFIEYQRGDASKLQITIRPVAISEIGTVEYEWEFAVPPRLLKKEDLLLPRLQRKTNVLHRI